MPAPGGAHQLNAAIVAEIAEEGREDGDVEHRGADDRRDRHPADPRGFPHRRGQRCRRRHGEAAEQEAHGVHARQAAQQHRIEAVQHHRQHDPGIAGHDAQMQQRARIAARHDHRDADQRYQDRRHLAQGRAFAEQHQGAEQDEHRDHRLHEQRVQRRGGLQPDIDQQVEAAIAGDAEDEQQPGAGFQRRPVGPDLARAAQPHDQRGHQHAAEHEDDGVDLVGNAAHEHRIGAPGQAGQHHEQRAVLPDRPSQPAHAALIE